MVNQIWRVQKIEIETPNNFQPKKIKTFHKIWKKKSPKKDPKKKRERELI
uniref:Uncharacterized protein n=1 Tax=Rhizophora mucronata TaxID=61149 RepID=A0A2P2JCC2_RHIMU